MKRFGKIVLWIVVALVALLVVVALVCGAVAKGYVNSHGEQLVGRKVQVDKLRLNLLTGHAAVHGLTLYEEDGTTPFASFDTLDVKAHLLRLIGHTVYVKHFSLAGLNVNLLQDGDRFNFSSIVDHFASDDKDTTPSDWTYNLNDLRLAHAQVDYHDVRNGKQWHIADMNLRVPGFVVGGKEGSEAGLNITLAEGGHMVVDANYDAATNHYDLNLEVKDFALNNVKDYVADVLPVRKVDGTLAANLKASGRVDEILKSRISGPLEVVGLSLQDSARQEIVGCGRLAVQLNEVNIDAHRFAIGSVAVEKPFVRYEQWPDHNTFSNASSRQENNSDDSKGTSKQIHLALDKLIVSGGEMQYVDHTLPDMFDVAVKNIRIDGNSLSLDGKGSAHLAAQLPGKGLLDVQWRGSLRQWKQSTDLTLSVKSFDLRELSPLAVAYTGFPIEGGMTTLDMRTVVEQHELRGDNHMQILNARVGDRRSDVTPEQRIPLKTALYILKDKDDRITIDLPVSGNVDAPKFSYIKLLWKTLGNFLVKVATSPLRQAADKLGFKGADLDFMAIEPNQTSLTDEQRLKLNQLAQVALYDKSLILTLEQQIAEGYEADLQQMEARNRMVADYLTGRGVPASRLFVISADDYADDGRSGYIISSQSSSSEE